MTARPVMTSTRLEAFSDGVIAILITIMVLDLKVPRGSDWAALRPLLPTFVSYLLSFVYLGIYWNNHHHLLHTVKTVNGAILWANLHLLFWLSLVPFVTGWMGEHRFAPVPTALYGVILLLAAAAYVLLQGRILAKQGPDSTLARALGDDFKGKLSLALYLTAVPAALYLPWIAGSLYALVALIWLIPDRRIERLSADEGDPP
jgi:uncharacterized membrane protein